MRIRHLMLLAAILFFSGCLTMPTVQERLVTADMIAQKNELRRFQIHAAPFLLTAYSKALDPGKELHIYIEGDGYAWVTRSRISGNPTPRSPVGLDLAAEDPASNVIYLARPCQYTPPEMDPGCADIYWTGMRFSGEVVNSMAQAVDWLVRSTKSPGVHLVGYSGGAAVAALIAAQRQDVKSLRSIAGNLDPRSVNEYHGVTPLDERSLDPMTAAAKLRTIPQYHFIGAKDPIIPAFIAENFSKGTGQSPCVHIVRVKGTDHVKGWEEVWPKLLAMPLSCSE